MAWLGSEKQIKWAIDIKSELVKQLDKLINYTEEYKNNPDDAYDNPSFRKSMLDDDISFTFMLKHAKGDDYNRLKATISAIRSSEDASWFIKHGRSGIVNALTVANGNAGISGGRLLPEGWRGLQSPQSKPTPKKEKSKEYTFEELMEIHQSRSPQARAADEARNHSKVIDLDDTAGVRRWIKDPGSKDIKRIDTPKCKKKKRKTPPTALKSIRRK